MSDLAAEVGSEGWEGREASTVVVVDVHTNAER